MISDNGEVSSVLGTVFSPRLVHVLCQKLQIPKSSQAPAAMGPYIFTFFKFFFLFLKLILQVYYYKNILYNYSKLKPNPLI